MSKTLHYVLVFDNRDQDIDLLRRFRDEERASRVYGELEEQYRDDSRYEVVMLGADSIDTIRKTHSRYFETQESSHRPKRDKLHVLPSGKEWALKREGANREAARFSTQREAISRAREIVRNRGGQIFVHSTDGKIRTGWSYESLDPFPPRSRPESEMAENIAERLSEQRQWRRRSEAFLNSKKGMELLRDEKSTLFHNVISNVSNLAESYSVNLRSNHIRYRDVLHIWGEGATVAVSWKPGGYWNDSTPGFHIAVWDGYPMDYVTKFREARLVKKFRYVISLAPDMTARWKLEGDFGPELSTEDLADRIVKDLLEQIQV